MGEENKDERIRKLEEELKKVIKTFEDFNLKIKAKDDLINNLTTSLALKDDQIKTLIDSMNLKEQQIDTLNKSLEIKNQKIKTLETSLNLKEGELKELISSTVKKNIIEEKDEEIEEYQKKLTILTEELEKADEDLEALEAENDKLRSNLASESDVKIIDSTFREIPKADILKKIREILGNAVHNVTIAVLDINDLQDLHLYEVRAHVNVKIMCSIDPSLEDDAEFLEELESLDNVTIRLYESRDRYLIDRDGEELLFSIVGEGENNNLTIYTKDAKHQRILRSLVMEGWLRARKLD
jgi:DNA repair exonuclease SbcCD ATPase subunit